MSNSNKYIIPISIFLFSALCLYNYLNFIPYDLYAVSPLFLWTSGFFIEHITNSFAFSNYLSLFFIQFFYSKFLASLVIAFLLTALFITCRRFFSCFSTSQLTVTLGSFAIVAGIFLIPEKNIIVDSICLLIILWCVLLLKKVAKHRNFWIGTLIVNFILWWTIQPLYIIYLIILPIVLFTENKKLSLKIFSANLLFAISLYSYRHFFVNFAPDFVRWVFIRDLYSIKYLLFLLLLISIPVVIKYINQSKHILTLLIGILIILCFNDVKYIYDNSDKNAEAIIKYKFNYGDWDSLLNYAIKKHKLSQTSAMCVNYALYKNKHLTDQAFHFNQNFSADGLIPEFKLNTTGPPSPLNFFYNKNSVLLGELYFDLGLFSMTQGIATDFLAHVENQPQALLLLTKNYLAYGEDEAAAKYAEILKKNPLYNHKVKNLILNAEKKRNVKVTTTNDVSISSSPFTNLYLLLISPGKNKMALEYYITYSLLKRNFATIPFIIEKLTEFGYTKLPHDFEYFIYLANSLHKKTYNTGNLKNNPKRYIQYSNFFNKLNKTRSKEEAQEALKEFKHSYMYYFICN